MAPDLAVPKFGNWDDPGNVQYTEYFERARNGKTGGLDALISTTRPKVGRGAESAAAATSLKPRISRECAVKSTRSPLHPGAVGMLPAVGTSRKCISGPQPRHPRGRFAGETSSPFQERRRQYSSDISDYKVAPRTPERLRIKPVVRGEPNRGNSVPKFGDWDEGNPSGGEGYTEIFNHVIDQKQSGGTEAVSTKTVKSMTSSHNDSHDNRHFKVCWCFPWRRRRRTN
ncbi:hypothetical protein MLD38_039478 [Melastoma candidum]|uniref:Uncharacterized protein n=1 Tax=Melastoma candidum TaxID=119954 RepID=A0ACB9L263_9MYRT|nr:hypothetical protein MLD38_039478 [Melastoma candidum]